MKKHRGFVMVTVLVFLQLFSIASATVLTFIHSMHKNGEQYWRYGEWQAKIDVVFTEMIDEIMSGHAAIHHDVFSSSRLIKLPYEWWQQQANMKNDLYYFIEGLGKDSCGVIENNPTQEYVPDYYRITVAVFPHGSAGEKWLWQETVASLARKTEPCQSKTHFVQYGIQTVRMIT